MIESVYECVCFHLYIFVYHLYSWFASKIVSFCANNNDLAFLRAIFIAINWLSFLGLVNFGLTRTLRTRIRPKRTNTSTKENRRQRCESVRESASDEEAAKGGRGEWTEGKIKDAVLFFHFWDFYFSFIVFFLGFSSLCFFSSVFPHNTFVFAFIMSTERENITFKNGGFLFFTVAIGLSYYFSLFIFSLLLLQMI